MKPKTPMERARAYAARVWARRPIENMVDPFAEAEIVRAHMAGQRQGKKAAKRKP